MNQGQHEHDTQLEALLDDALGPEPTPAGLTDRLVTASVAASRSAAARAAAQPSEPAQSAQSATTFTRWSSGPMAMAAAAVIALTIIGAWALLDIGPTTPTTPGPNDGFESVAMLGRELDHLDQAVASSYDPMDEQIELLALQLEVTQTDPLWPGTSDPLAAATSDIRSQQLLHEYELVWEY